MSFLLVILIILALLIVGVPSVFFLITWVKSFNRLGIVYREVGNDPNNAQREFHKFKVTTQRGLGQYIKFFFGGKAVPESKAFSSKNWFYIRDGKKTKIGLPFYLVRDTYRPLILDEEDEVLRVEATDSREFKLRRFIHKKGARENNRLFLTCVLVLVAFLALITIIYAITVHFLTVDVAQSILTGAPAPVVVG